MRRSPRTQSPQTDAETTGDGTYGFDLEMLRAVSPVPPPEGFAELWRAWRRQASQTELTAEVLSVHEQDGRRVSVVGHAGADGLRLRSWLAEPRRGPGRVAVVHGHGYGGRDRPDFARVPDDAWALFPVARGLGALNTDVGAPRARDDHVVTGIDDPERFVPGLCARDLWRAADVVDTASGGLPLYYVGESFGGGIGALAVPWDERFVGATFSVPTFGQYDERLAVASQGSGEAMRHRVRARPELREILRWFDASTAAGFLRIPVRVEAALRDRNVPPQGQFAIANAIALAEPPADLELFVLPAGHMDFPGQSEIHRRAAAEGIAHLERVIGPC